MAHFSRRLPHVLTRADLVLMLAPTYAKARGVDEEEAGERLARALSAPAALDELYEGISAALAEAKGPRTSEDAMVDRISGAVAARRARARAAEATPAVSAVLVRLDLEVGLAPETMRATLASPRGRALLDEGFRAVGAHLVKELLRG
ncbi:MAG TPA: hypothetical protein VLS93_02020 [Anaeromyxobacteraceae bacterium]|nr:hypothetical protein [Anaeromyxobacteraceae bacterium]